MTDELKQWEYDRGYEKGKADVLDKISVGYKSAYQQGYSDAMRDFRKKSETDMLDKIRADVINIADSRRSMSVRSVINIIDKYREGHE